MLARSVEELRVYQRAFAAAMRIYELSKTWPREERYSLTDQIRRSSRSVCGNMAEAWAKRRYVAHFVTKLTDADGEAAETRTWPEFARHCGYLAEADANHLREEYLGISGGLAKMIADPTAWCGPSTQVRETTPDYETSL